MGVDPKKCDRKRKRNRKQSTQTKKSISYSNQNENKHSNINSNRTSFKTKKSKSICQSECSSKDLDSAHILMDDLDIQQYVDVDTCSIDINSLNVAREEDKCATNKKEDIQISSNILRYKNNIFLGQQRKKIQLGTIIISTSNTYENCSNNNNILVNDSALMVSLKIQYKEKNAHFPIFQ